MFISEREHELKERGETPPRNRLELALSRADRYQKSFGSRTFPRWFAEGRPKRLITRLVARQTSRCGGAFSSFALIPMLAGAGNNVDIGTLGSQAVGAAVSPVRSSRPSLVIKNKMTA